MAMKHVIERERVHAMVYVSEDSLIGQVYEEHNRGFNHMSVTHTLTVHMFKFLLHSA